MENRFFLVSKKASSVPSPSQFNGLFRLLVPGVLKPQIDAAGNAIARSIAIAQGLIDSVIAVFLKPTRRVFEPQRSQVCFLVRAARALVRAASCFSVTRRYGDILFPSSAAWLALCPLDLHTEPVLHLGPIVF